VAFQCPYFATASLTKNPIRRRFGDGADMNCTPNSTPLCRGVLTDSHLNSGAHSFLRIFEQASSNLFFEVFFSAVCANTRRDTFDNERSAGSFKGNGNFAPFCTAFLADDAFHGVFLFLKSVSHSLGFGS
jgi:hypothetical protein